MLCLFVCCGLLINVVKGGYELYQYRGYVVLLVKLLRVGYIMLRKDVVEANDL